MLALLAAANIIASDLTSQALAVEISLEIVGSLVTHFRVSENTHKTRSLRAKYGPDQVVTISK